MHGLTGGSWKRHTDRTRATEMKDTRGNLAVTSGSETYRRCALPRQLSTLLAQYLQKLDPALVAPVAAFLTHQDCSVSGEIYTVGAACRALLHRQDKGFLPLAVHRGRARPSRRDPRRSRLHRSGRARRRDERAVRNRRQLVRLTISSPCGSCARSAQQLNAVPTPSGGGTDRRQPNGWMPAVAKRTAD